MRSSILSGCAGGVVAIGGMLLLGVGQGERAKGQPGGDSMVFKDAQGRPRLVFGADPDPAIFMTDAKGNRLITLAVVDDMPLIKLASAYDAKSIRLQVEGKGGGYLVVEDSKKQERIKVGGSDVFYTFNIRDDAR